MRFFTAFSSPRIDHFSKRVLGPQLFATCSSVEYLKSQFCSSRELFPLEDIFPKRFQLPVRERNLAF